MKKRLHFLANTLLFLAFAWMLFQRVPLFYEQFKKEGTQLKSYTLTTLDGSSVILPVLKKKAVFVFWATWCAPCSVELERINTLMRDKEINIDSLYDSIYAVNMGEDHSLIKKTIEQKGYLFQVVVDSRGHLTRDLNIKATPSLVFVDEDQKIEWISSGLSPTLVFRLKQFLAPN